MNNFIIRFGVRNCKTRGILIESMTYNELDVFFFNYRDQPLDRHCVQMQNIVRKANVKRTKIIDVDISEFIYEYYNAAEKVYKFRGTKLTSNGQQFTNAANLSIKKEIGNLKRKETIADKKQKKIDEHNRKLIEKFESQERLFQMQRAKLITEMNVNKGAAGGKPLNIGNEDQGDEAMKVQQEGV